jgi:hypothetical protein
VVVLSLALISQIRLLRLKKSYTVTRIFAFCNDNMIQAKVFPFFLLLMGSHGDFRGSSVEAVGKKASAVRHALLVDEEATPSLKKGPPWPDFDGASAIYSGPGPPNLLIEDKEVRAN